MGGFGNTSSTSSQAPTDPEAARRMAAVAERQQAMAEEQWSLSKEIFEPYQRQMVASNQALIKPNEDLMQARMAEGVRDIALDQPLKDTVRQQRIAELGTSEGIVKKFYDEAGKPVDVAGREAEAEAQVVSEYANVPGSVRRGLSRTGTALTGTRYESMLKSIALDRARAISGARATAKRQAEGEGVARLATAMQMRSGAQNPTIAGTAYAQGEGQLGNYTLQNPAQLAQGLYGNAINALEAGMRPLTTGDSSGMNWKIL